MSLSSMNHRGPDDSASEPEQQRTETTPLFKPFPLDADSLASNLWWPDPCRGIKPVPGGETARDVRRRMIQQTTALIDGHVKPLLDDFKTLLPDDFDYNVYYVFFPDLPADQDDAYYQNQGKTIFFRTAMDMFECFAMIEEQVLCDQENHHPSLTPRIIQMQQRTRPLICSCQRTMFFVSVTPNQAIYRSLMPNSFRTNATMAECNKKCYCTFRDHLAALKYNFKGFMYWDGQISAEEDGVTPGSGGRRADGKQKSETTKTDDEDVTSQAGSVESRKA